MQLRIRRGGAVLYAGPLRLAQIADLGIILASNEQDVITLEVGLKREASNAIRGQTLSTRLTWTATQS
ncbi:MAG: hypothetical protein HY329_21950 [Chloroflexi bacterium]|nr:hypothetical protein [Chloroflexota bacterium]